MSRSSYLKSANIGLSISQNEPICLLMMQGRRVYEQQGKESFVSRKIRVLNKPFQYKYSLYLLAAVAGSAIIYAIPVFYFLNQNYELLSSLTLDHAPELLTHLEREIFWLNAFMIIAGISTLSFVAIISLKLTHRIIAPLLSLQKHIKKLTAGQWTEPELAIRDSEDFRDIVATYNYMYKSLRANAEAELKQLEKLTIDPDNREAHAAWQELLRRKRSLLGISDTDFSASDYASNSDGVRSLRRVS
jgi:hypothetical protein